MLVSLYCSFVIGLIFVGMILSYTKKRQGRQYALGRNPAPSIRHFAKFSKILFFINMLVSLISFWFRPQAFLTLFDNPLLEVFGASIVLGSYAALHMSFKALGDAYSPMFDAYLPKQIVRNGMYRYIRHPIYLFNLLINLGLCLASGSALVLLSSVISSCYVFRAIQLEEEYLTSHFAEYAEYRACSWRILPFLY